MDEADPCRPDDVQLRLDGFEGPLDLLLELELARRQAVDLARISVTALVDQYLSATADITRHALARVADWLVMAAWLVWLKSRLLLPKDLEEARQADAAARILTDRLAALERIHAVSRWLEQQPQLGRDIFARGRHDDLAAIRVQTTGYRELFEAAGALLQAAPRPASPEPAGAPRLRLWTVDQAMARLRQLVGALPDGSALVAFVPQLAADAPSRFLRTRVAVCSTLVAGLELARGSEIRLEQAATFGPITVHAIVRVSAGHDMDSRVAVGA